MDTFVSTIEGAAVAAVITFLCSWYFYMRAAKGLSRVTRGLEEAGLVQYNRDQSGNIIGLVLSGKASLASNATLKADGDVVPRKP
jgi:hypothetical protein